MSDNTFTLSDDTIAHIAKVLQVAILTGTDIVDNLRQIQLEADGRSLLLSPDTVENFENNIQNLMDSVASEDTDTDSSTAPSFDSGNSIFNS